MLESEIFNTLVKMIMIFIFIQAKNIKDSIPSSDLYIFERHKFFRKFPKESVIAVQLISMLAALLNSNERGIFIYSKFVQGK